MSLRDYFDDDYDFEEDEMDLKDKLISIILISIFFIIPTVLALVDEGIISFGPPEYPKKVTQEQLQSLRMTSVISNWCLPDSIHHYVDSIVLKSSSAILFMYIQPDAKELMKIVESRLQQMGFVINDYGSKRFSHYDFYWLSAENGNVFVHVTSIQTGNTAYISVATGKDVKEVLSIRIVTDGEEAELESEFSYKPSNPSVTLTAPLSGTIYAIYYPNEPLCGNPNDEVNILAKKSFENILLKTNARSPKLELLWACDGYYNVSRLTPTHLIVWNPRGVAYAKTVLTGFGIK
ncbi:hypothetical protein [Archaeoglobus sp.]